MPKVISTTVIFANGDQVTSDKLNEITDGSEFTVDAIIGNTLAVVGGQLKVNSITNAEIAADAVTAITIRADAVTTVKIQDGAVTTSKLGALAVDNTKLGNSSVTPVKISATSYATQAVVESPVSGYIVDPTVTKYIPGAAKAYGAFAITGTGRTVQAGSLNVTSLARVSATQTLVTLAANMSTGNYTIIVSGNSDGTEIVDACAYSRNAGNFSIKHTTEGAGRGIYFTVFGTLA